MPETAQSLLKDQQLANLYGDMLKVHAFLTGSYMGGFTLPMMAEQMTSHLLKQQGKLVHWINHCATQDKRFKGKHVVGVNISGYEFLDPERVANVKPDNYLIMTPDLINHYGRYTDKNWQTVDFPAKV